MAGVHDVDDRTARLPPIMLWTAYFAVSMMGVRVQRLVMPSGMESTTVLADGLVVDPVDRFLAHLTAIDRSLNTVRAYAHDLRDYFEFLECRGLQWDRVALEDLGRFVTWLRLPGEARDGRVAMLPWVEANLAAATVNRKLSALASFYEFHQRHGVALGELLTRWWPGRRGGSWQPFLAHRGARPERHRAISLRAERRPPRELSQAEMMALIDSCDRLRDKLLLSLLKGTGLRIGEALGLRHEDLDARRRLVAVRPRENVNRARAKTWSREVPADTDLFRLYSDYLHEEYGLLDCDYVFVNLWGSPVGAPMSYASVDRMVRRLRERTGIAFSPHLFRHSYATGLQMSRVALGASFGKIRVVGRTTAETVALLEREGLDPVAVRQAVAEYLARAPIRTGGLDDESDRRFDNYDLDQLRATLTAATSAAVSPVPVEPAVGSQPQRSDIDTCQSHNCLQRPFTHHRVSDRLSDNFWAAIVPGGIVT